MSGHHELVTHIWNSIYVSCMYIVCEYEFVTHIWKYGMMPYLYRSLSAQEPYN